MPHGNFWLDRTHHQSYHSVHMHVLYARFSVHYILPRRRWTPHNHFCPIESWHIIGQRQIISQRHISSQCHIIHPIECCYVIGQCHVIVPYMWTVSWTVPYMWTLLFIFLYFSKGFWLFWVQNCCLFYYLIFHSLWNNYDIP